MKLSSFKKIYELVEIFIVIKKYNCIHIANLINNRKGMELSLSLFISLCYYSESLDQFRLMYYEIVSSKWTLMENILKYWQK